MREIEKIEGISAGAVRHDDPTDALKQMFVDEVQVPRIRAGQCPALRPVFLKPHGVVRGTFRVREDLPGELRVGIFQDPGREYPLWIRFSSDTRPDRHDYQSTVGVGIKLFDVPGAKILDNPADTTFDFILQNMDVFFVDTARDMAEFTRASLDGKLAAYLADHKRTQQILNDMMKPVASVLASPYWSILPFRLGPRMYVKYKLEPTVAAEPLTGPPVDPCYLAADLAARMASGEVRLRFCVQPQRDPEAMPLDRATVPWSEVTSPPVHVADLVLPAQDIGARGQPAYGENFACNIWRVTGDHAPAGSIAEARRVVYAASAATRRDANGVPTGEPTRPRPGDDPGACKDRVVVRAAIHPAIGIARIGDSPAEFYVGPQVTDPPPRPGGFYRDATGALKREAAEFRIYGYNAAGEPVVELTADNADITWTVHVANRKAQWYQFQLALDIPDAAGRSMPRRNKYVPKHRRGELAIDPGPRSIRGKSTAGGPEHAFDTGRFVAPNPDDPRQTNAVVVPLGELQTDASGRLRFLGGRGKSASLWNKPPYDPDVPTSFSNADTWYDDISDGPVTATVSIRGRSIPVEHAWVVVAPPNYGTNLIGWRTMYDLLTDTYVRSGWLPMPTTTSFTRDVLPFLRRLSNLQWVNKGFASLFGKGAPLDFEDTALVARLARAPARPGGPDDTWAELRRVVLNSFRPARTPDYDPRAWPWIYGDAFGSSTQDSPRNLLDLPSVLEVHLRRWASGEFVGDWDPAAKPPARIEELDVAAQPAMLDRAALHFCLADAFHPGCEMTWPVRHASMYARPFRFRLRPADAPEPDCGPALTPDNVTAPGGPLYDQTPGSITRWMAIPWQGDTGFCRSGYAPDYDPYLPSFWPARVPNQVLTEEDYQVVMDTARPREERLAAFNRRATWTRALATTPVEAMMQMVDGFAAMGVIEARPGVAFDPDFPPVIYVESIPEHRRNALRARVQQLTADAGEPPTPVQAAGWVDEQHLAAFAAVRLRFTS